MYSAGQHSLSWRQWEAHVSQAISSGRGSQEMLRAMLAANWPERDARELIGRVVSRMRLVAIVTMLAFGLLALVALAVTIGTHEAATRAGGVYFIWWGGILAGVVGFVYGLVRFIKTLK